MKISTHQGSVLYFYDDQLDSPKPHWHIVLNLKPLDDGGCHVAICTSKADRYRDIVEKTPRLADTVVFIPQSAYPSELTCETVVDCNKLQFISDAKLKDAAVNRQSSRLRQCKNFPPFYLKKIIDGVLLSRITDNAVRATILDVPEASVPSEMFKRFGFKLKEHLPKMYEAEAAKNTIIPTGNPRIRIVVSPH